MFFNFIPCQDIFHTLKKQFHTLTFKFLFSYLKKLFSYSYTKISYLAKTFFIPLNFYFHTFVDLFHTLGTFFIPFRPGTLRLMTTPRDPARLDCEHPLPSPAVAHPCGDRAFEFHLFFCVNLYQGIVVVLRQSILYLIHIFIPIWYENPKQGMKNDI